MLYTHEHILVYNFYYRLFLLVLVLTLHILECTVEIVYPAAKFLK